MFKHSSACHPFQATYSRWYEEQQIYTQELRLGIYSNKAYLDLQPLVEKTKTHFAEILEIKKSVAKEDCIQIIYGMWTTPAERCITWVGGFQPSDILKVSTQQKTIMLTY